MKDYDFSVISAEPPPNATPEHILWLAVIDRAIVDYIRWYDDLNIKHKKSLHWFLFEPKPVPNNLQYLCELLFDNHDAATTIRKRINFLADNPGEQHLIKYNQCRYRRVKNSFT